MRPRETRRAERCLKYYGDIFGIKTKTAMDLKCREANKRRREMIKERKNENKRIEKETARLLRENERLLAERYQPKH